MYTAWDSHDLMSCFFILEVTWICHFHNQCQIASDRSMTQSFIKQGLAGALITQDSFAHVSFQPLLYAIQS